MSFPVDSQYFRASDKTGTLTKNEMVVCDLWYSNEYISEIDQNKANQRTMSVRTISKVEHPLSDLLVAMTICNKVFLLFITEKTRSNFQASFEDENAPTSAKKIIPPISFSDVNQKSDVRSKSKRTSKVHIEMPTIEESDSKAKVILGWIIKYLNAYRNPQLLLVK